ncbi:spore germination B3 GerAC family protein [Alkaliphilus metalliredigens QYMF]|uniref:Spore germination B3 GerAC family protein n=1 Tax=Alkaliphilus metalliredigens (strain QYMF) TaxID=293826 RepID=A6TSP6_ALKMQ|nr:Ger(x)C family spore germination protein [Alkaliphilus metalliredigens]ABR49214.1 spore germination B3 GerAC family protein [Alkaliphilus metalliredigens QYMF]
MKKLMIIIVLMSTLLMGGCYSYNDINRMLFPTAIIVDVDEEGNPILYLEVFHAFRSNQDNTESGQRILLRQEGATITDVAQKLEEVAAHQYSYTQNKAWIFTERAAHYGIGDFLDYMHRHQDALLRPYVAVYFGDPVALLNLELKQNEYLGLFLFDLFDRPLRRLTVDHKKLYEVLNQRRMGGNVMVMTALQLEKHLEDDKVSKYGAAVFRDDKMVSKIGLTEMQSYSFLVDEARAGRLNIPHPQYEDKLLTLGILKSKTVTELTYDGEKVYLKKQMNIRTTITGAEQSLILDEKIIDEIKKNTAEKMKKETHELFDRYQEMGVDIFRIQESFDRRYPRADVKNVITITELEVEVNQHNEGSMNTYDFR